jgi:hypothetical protein
MSEELKQGYRELYIRDGGKLKKSTEFSWWKLLNMWEVATRETIIYIGGWSIKESLEDENFSDVN